MRERAGLSCVSYHKGPYEVEPAQFRFAVRTGQLAAEQIVAAAKQ